jgi:hypothetical protein
LGHMPSELYHHENQDYDTRSRTRHSGVERFLMIWYDWSLARMNIGSYLGRDLQFVIVRFGLA